MALLNLDQRIVRVNREFTRMFGYGPLEVVQRHMDELIVPPELKEEYRRNFSLASSGRRIDVEVLRKRKDGTPLHVSLLGVPVSVPGGQIALYAIFRDISERKRAEEALRTFRRRLIETQEADRRRIARELHDEIGQVLTSVGMTLASSEKLPPEQARLRLSEARSLLDDLIGKVRGLALDLRPAMLDDFGLVPALRWLFKRYAEADGHTDRLRRIRWRQLALRPEIETAAYRIVQEALTNVARHAEVREAAVRIGATEDSLRVEIEDHGVGFDPQLIQSSGLVRRPGRHERTSQHPRRSVEHHLVARSGHTYRRGISAECDYRCSALLIVASKASASNGLSR